MGASTDLATATTRGDSTESASDARKGGVDLASVVAMWPAVLDALKAESRVAWTAFAQTLPVSVSDGAIAVAFPDQGRITFALQSRQDERLRVAILEVLKLDLRPDLVLSPDQAKSDTPAKLPTTTESKEPPKPAGWRESPDQANAESTTPSASPISTDSAALADNAALADDAPLAEEPVEKLARRDSSGVEPTSEKPAPKRRTPRKIPAKSESDAAVDLRVVDADAPSVNDADVVDDGLAGVSLVEHVLGGKVVTEFDGS